MRVPRSEQQSRACGRFGSASVPASLRKRTEDGVEPRFQGWIVFGIPIQVVALGWIEARRIVN